MQQSCSLAPTKDNLEKIDDTSVLGWRCSMSDLSNILKAIREIQDADACLLGASGPGLKDRISSAMSHHRSAITALTAELEAHGVKPC